jgi:two-component sensor histidine kinase/GAF domain-containing protein
LSRASQTVTASLDLDQVLSEIVSLAGKVANSDYASVVLVDEEGHIIGRSAETLPGAPALEYRARGGGFTHWIIQSRRPAVVDDIGEDGSIRSDPAEGVPTTINPVLSVCGIKSFVGLPLIFKERLLGVLYLHSLHPYTFSDQLPLLTAFANQAAVAVENANLYDVAQRELAERKSAEEVLSRTVSLLEATLNSTADGILVVDLEGKIKRFNENFKKMWRIPPAILETGEDDRALGFVLDQLKDPEEFLSKVRQLYGEVLAESYDVLEFKDGRVFERFSRPQLLEGTPVGRVWSFRDVTKRVKDEEKLRTALGEREVMLREIHHRVKNNIQIISSLLRLQSRYIKDEKALELLDESQNRIRSMALIHEKLYQSQDLSRIDFSDYIAKMITHLFAIYKVEFSRIRHRVDANKIQLDINRAIPCGLIINELITNALKHAFPEDREGELIITMLSLAGDQYELTVKDNGMGLPEGFDPAKKGTLGFQIVNDLVKQLDGSIEVRGDKGTEIVIRF